ncbi:MAG: UDP-N-acetylmuramoyl-L-alanyl-D-glutamate--2,6-diaminopimelate ligase [Hyphomicrobiales bacterium]|nr:UDP-N-acetylmuramoyl-L-alanyl-D-glutamate--2,6-diaminopimelate ligase [Hyphomicrobiales bacterium]MCP5371207.1 UDP-N-acetylmuramoyl-L-alanyl-D-glutamate--2,6-diaminopimelate ligase [Hyphomicrobiales bacterium]
MAGVVEKVARGGTFGNVEITGLTCDSRRVEPGFLFAALPGTQTDGRRFIAEALGRGAAAVLAPPGTRLAAAEPAVPVVTDANPRRLFALMAARFFGAQPRTVAAVTGTNGKSSVVAFLRQMWQAAGQPAASLGTLGLVAPGFPTGASLTTPDPVALHATLRDLAAAGIDHVALEASSHGLDQYRLDGVRVGLAAFTNLTRDHLDYHGTLEEYAAAKARLFRDILAEDGVAVLNADSRWITLFAEACGDRRIMTFGDGGEDFRLMAAAPSAAGQTVYLQVLGRDVTVDLPMVGGFQAMNALCALALFTAGGGDADAGIAAMAGLKAVTGRLELVARTAAGAAAYVDYAHTPDGLKTALEALRPHTPGRLVVVFGCGGDRDPGKRPLMGEAAARLADEVIVTDDNPRTEDAAAIRREVLAGCPDAAEVGGRAEAIRAALAGAGAGDVVLVAGKGHETGQIVGDTVLPFEDAAEVRAAIAEMDGAAEEART